MKPTLLFTVAAAASAALGFAQDTTTQSTCQLTRWQPSDLASLARMGESVAIDGNTALVGAPGSDRVFVYHRNFSTWHLFTTLESPTGSGMEFGRSVAVAGTRAYVGAPMDDLGGVNAGAVHCYEFSGGTWNHVHVLLDPTPTAQGRLGHAVDASGGWLAVGAPGDGVSGRAHVWNVAPPIPVHLREFGQFLASDNFASAIAMHRAPGAPYAQVFVGSFGDDVRGTNAGAVWHTAVSASDITYGGALRPLDLGAHDLFGFALDFDGQHLAVGARGHDAVGVDAGAVYVYDVGAAIAPLVATQTAKFTAPEPGVGDQFGYSVAVSGKRIAAGARLQEWGGDAVGLVHLFQPAIFGQAWNYDRTLAPEDALVAQNFGSAVALFGHQVLVGSMYHHIAGFQAGAAYLFSTAFDAGDGGLCPSEHLTAAYTYGTTKTGPNAAPLLSLNSPAVPGQNALLAVSGLVQGSPSLLLVGTAGTQIPFDGGHILVADPILVQLPIPTFLGQVGVAWSVPNQPSLEGVPIFLQAYSFDPGASGEFQTVHSRGLILGVGY